MAFMVENLALEEVTDAQRDEMIDAFARKVVARRLETPAVFFLEAHKPLSFVASQSLLLGAPLLGAFFGFRNVNRWARILEERENVERLIKRIEILAQEADQSRRAQS